MYEHRAQPLLPRRVFLRRLLRHGGAAGAMVAGALALGVSGYHFIEGLPWIDALENASMILGGMGPVTELHTNGGKMFASFYALFAGLFFIVIVGTVFAPVFHRFLHKFHADTSGRRDSRAGNR